MMMEEVQTERFGSPQYIGNIAQNYKNGCAYPRTK